MEALENELASVVRVRQRIATTTTVQLPGVLQKLLPRLLSRLEDNARELSSEISTEERLVREKIQNELAASFSVTVTERIRANSEMPVPWLEPVSLFLSSALQGQNTRGTVSAVTMTISLSLLQLGVTRCSADDPEVHLVLEACLRAVDDLYNCSVKSATEHCSVILRSASWTCLDAIAISMGMKPIIDWELDYYDYKHIFGATGWPTTVSAKVAKSAAHPGAVQPVAKDGTGVFDLFLDVILLWPDRHSLSQEGNSRGRHRSHRFPFSAYLCDLKIACLRYAVWPVQKGLFQGEGPGDIRAMILIVLAASKNSNIGRMAQGFLSGYLGPPVKQKRQKTDNPSSVPVKCSLSLACSLLVLVLGDVAAIPILERYPQQLALWEDILGRRCLGHPLERRPLPSAMSAAAMDFIIQSNSDYLLCCEEGDEIRLFVDLASAAQKQDDYEGQRAVQLVSTVACNPIMHSEHFQHDAWTEALYESCVSDATEILSTAFSPPNDGRQERFERRRDITRRIASHRRALKEQSRKDEVAMKGRASCYQMIRDLSGHTSSSFLWKGDRLSFEVPVLIFKCALDEEERLQTIASEALTSLLTLYKDIILKEDTGKENDESVPLQHQAAPLLPSLLATVCCDSTVVRLVSLMWVKELLYPIDPLAACLLCSYFADDVEGEVSQAANALLRQNAGEETSRQFTSLRNESTTPKYCSMTFIDLRRESDFAGLCAELDSKIMFVAETAQIQVDAATLLLLNFDFRVQETLNELAKDRESAFKVCGLTSRCRNGESRKRVDRRSDKLVCGVCYEDVRASDMYSLPCDHEFCKSCWSSLIETELQEGPSDILRATCLSLECNERLTNVDIKELAPDLLPVYNRRLLQSYIERDKSYCWCPGPNCDVVVKAENDLKKVTCEWCYTSFCFGCGKDPHSPAACEAMKIWGETFADSRFWIAKNTKPCPECNSPIEKNQGCNHMTCSQCRCEFCWLCLTIVSNHSEPHTCNTYNPLENESEDDMNRKVFYSERFQAHEEAEIFARRQNEKREENVGRLLRRHPFLANEAFDVLETSGETLVECQHFLKYSYVAGYTMRNVSKRNLEAFEKLQGTLEVFTEKLSELMEIDMEKVVEQKGHRGVQLHFRSLSFYSVSVTKYAERMLSFMLQLEQPVPYAFCGNRKNH